MDSIFLVFSIAPLKSGGAFGNCLCLELATLDRYEADQKAEYLIERGRYYETVERPLGNMKPETILKY